MVAWCGPVARFTLYAKLSYFPLARARHLYDACVTLLGGQRGRWCGITGDAEMRESGPIGLPQFVIGAVDEILVRICTLRGME
jgi:hypothetical protein